MAQTILFICINGVFLMSKRYMRWMYTNGTKIYSSKMIFFVSYICMISQIRILFHSPLELWPFLVFSSSPEPIHFHVTR